MMSISSFSHVENKQPFDILISSVTITEQNSSWKFLVYEVY